MHKSRLAAFIMLALGACLRCPQILLHGRVWAEESSTFLAKNWHMSVVHILCAPQLGYFSLWSNLWTAVAVRGVAVPFASFVFSGASFLLLLAVGAVIYEAEFLPSSRAKLAGVAALLFTTGSVESWLNLINGQFYFAVSTAVVLASSADRLRWLRNLALSIAVVSSPVAALLTPLFVWRAYRERSWDTCIQAVVMLAGTCLQTAVALTTTTANRTITLHASELGPILLNKDVVFPLLGRPLAVLSGRLLLRFTPASIAVSWFLLLLCVAGFILLFRKSRDARLLFGAALCLGSLETLLALGGGLLNVQPGFGERYALAPNCLLLLSMLTALFQADRPAKKRWLKALLGCACAAGMLDYAWLPLRVHSNYDAPPWYTQARRWELDETLPLQPNPDGWDKLRLSHKH